MFKALVTVLVVVQLAVVAIAGTVATPAVAFTFILSSSSCGFVVGIQLCWESPTQCHEAGCHLEGSQSAKIESGGELLFVVPSIPVEILCKSTKGEATIEQRSEANYEVRRLPLKLESCTLVGENTVAKKCLVNSPTSSLIRGEPGLFETLVLAGEPTGGVLIEFEFTNKVSETCPATVKGRRKVTGTQEVVIKESSFFTEKKTSEFVSKSGLLFIEKAAELTGALTVAMENELGEGKLGDLWGIE